MQTIFYKDFLLRFLKNQNFAVVFCRYNKSKVSKEGYSPWTRVFHLKKVTAQWLQRNACRKGLQNVDSQCKVRKLSILSLKRSTMHGENIPPSWRKAQRYCTRCICIFHGSYGTYWAGNTSTYGDNDNVGSMETSEERERYKLLCTAQWQYNIANHCHVMIDVAEESD